MMTRIDSWEMSQEIYHRPHAVDTQEQKLPQGRPEDEDSVSAMKTACHRTVGEYYITYVGNERRLSTGTFVCYL